MRWLLLIVLSGLLNSATAQSDSVQLKTAIAKLDQALLQKDSSALDQLLDKHLSFGHSNGWVQTKREVWDDFKTGRLHYGSLETSGMEITTLTKDLATVTLQVKASGRLGDKEFNLNLHVMQVWKKDKKGWQLFARQSAKRD